MTTKTGTVTQLFEAVQAAEAVRDAAMNERISASSSYYLAQDRKQRAERAHAAADAAAKQAIETYRDAINYTGPRD